jgi:hypothetical protein
VPSRGLWERRGHAESVGLEGRRERPPRGHGQPRPVADTSQVGAPPSAGEVVERGLELAAGAGGQLTDVGDELVGRLVAEQVGELLLLVH